MVKDQIFHFKLTPEQRETILAGAKRLDVSASEFVRVTVLAGARALHEASAESEREGDT